MTYNEIIKALEVCSDTTTESCNGCPFIYNCKQSSLKKIALDLIKRQKAEIEGLNYNLRIRQKNKKTIESEARKEFAEELKKSKCSYDLPNYHSFDAVDINDIDNLLKEMESKSNAE